MCQKLKEKLAYKKLERATVNTKLKKDIWDQEKPLIEQENQINIEKHELKQEKRKAKLPS